MVYFRQTIINQIKSAANEREVLDVVNDSIRRLQIKNIHGHIIERYVTSMGIALLRAKEDLESCDVRQNIECAIEIFRKKTKSN